MSDTYEFLKAQKDAILAKRAAPDGLEVVAWQERAFTTRWSDWYDCRPRLATEPMQVVSGCSTYQWRKLTLLASAQVAVEYERNRYLQVTAQTCRAEDRVEALEAALGVARECILEQRYSSSTFKAEKLSSDALALIDKTLNTK